MAATLTQKLQLKPGKRLLVLNPPQGYFDGFATEVPQASQEPGPAEAVLLFVSSLAEAA